mgnify:CR=1 FL=1
MARLLCVGIVTWDWLYRVDEIPLAYKDLDEVLAAERDLVTVEARLAPLVVHKGTG